MSEKVTMLQCAGALRAVGAQLLAFRPGNIPHATS